MKKKCVILLSGGLDSTTCLALMVKEYGSENILALSTFYGQKQYKEIESARRVAEFYGASHMTADIADAFKLSANPLLLNSTEKIKDKTYAEQLEDMGGSGTVSSYVPFRNGIMLSYAAVIALSVGAEVICYGPHKDDFAGGAYPDCSPEFIKAFDEALYEGSGSACHLITPLIEMDKYRVVKTGILLGAPYKYTRSCYEEEPCGVCGACRLRKEVFERNGVKDPALEVE